MGQLAIDAADITKTYRSGQVSTPVLRGVSFTVAQGECVYLAGPSGSGKTTLLSILGCVLSLDAGQLRILDQDVTRFSAKEQARFRRERIGILFQRFHLFRGLTAAENVAVALKLLGYSTQRAKSESQQLLDQVGLAEKANSPVTKLSVGQCQRVALARALAGDPDLILADEPTASLDGETGMKAMQLLRNLSKESGKTVVVVTHDTRIFYLADRILQLEDGQIFISPTNSALCREHAALGCSPTK